MRRPVSLSRNTNSRCSIFLNSTQGQEPSLPSGSRSRGLRRKRDQETLPIFSILTVPTHTGLGLSSLFGSWAMMIENQTYLIKRSKLWDIPRLILKWCSIKLILEQISQLRLWSASALRFKLQRLISGTFQVRSLMQAPSQLKWHLTILRSLTRRERKCCESSCKKILRFRNKRRLLTKKLNPCRWKQAPTPSCTS